MYQNVEILQMALLEKLRPSVDLCLNVFYCGFIVFTCLQLKRTLVPIISYVATSPGLYMNVMFVFIL